MQNESYTLWSDFKAGLKRQLSNVPAEEINDAWTSRSQRTAFYCRLFPLIANDMQLQCSTMEHMRIDFNFSTRASTGYYIPKVYIESEHNEDSTDIESFNLCSLNAPLKIIVLCFNWNSEREKQYLDNDYHWRYVFEAFIEKGMLCGYFGIIIADENEPLYKCFLYDDKAQRIEDIAPL